MKEQETKHYKRVSTDLTRQSWEWLTGKAAERGVTVAEFLRLLVESARVNDQEADEGVKLIKLLRWWSAG